MATNSRKSNAKPASKSKPLIKRAVAPSKEVRATPSKKLASAKARDRASSKQDKVLELLRAPSGTTIATITKATGWQQHSVRGFFAGTVRKKLKLNLTSVKTDGQRVYRVAKQAAAK